MSNTPQIRFAGFTDAWEQRKLGEVLEISTCRNGNSYTKEDVLSVSDEFGCVNQIRFQGRSFAGADISNYKIVSTGDIVYTRSPLQAKPFGIIKIVRDESGVVSPLYIVNKVINGNDAEFIYRVFDLPYKTNNYLSPLVRKGAKNTMNISEDEWLSGDIIVSPIGEEQQAIGAFFKDLDNLITLHQRKCDALKKFKKSMLQKMFPQNGESVPEIRFAGFTDAWEQRKFSDFTFPAGERNKDDLDLEPFAITNNQGFIAQSEAHDDFGYMKDVDRKMYIVVKPNSFAYNPARINVGSLGYYEGTENVIVSSLYEVFQTAEYVDDKFLKHWFKTKAFQDWIERLQEGSVRLYFYYDKLCECIMSMPSVEEQRKIGAYLDKIDNLITLHQRKLETLQKMKKSLLQKMFV